MEIKINLQVVELAECEVITVNKPKGFGTFDCVNSEKGNRFFFKNITPIFFFSQKIQEIYRHRNALPTCE